MSELELNNKLILRKLRELNVKEVSIHFSGSGDSGDRDGVMVEPVVELPQDIVDAIESLEETMNDGTGIDWWNNDGGNGDFKIDVESGMANIDITSNDTEDSPLSRETFQLDSKDNEDLLKAFKSGVETLTGEFSGYDGEDISDITLTPAGKSFNRDVLSQIIRDSIQKINFKEPPGVENPYQTDYSNGDYVIKLGEHYSILKIEAVAVFECDGDSGGSEVDMEEEV